MLLLLKMILIITLCLLLLIILLENTFNNKNKITFISTMLINDIIK